MHHQLQVYAELSEKREIIRLSWSCWSDLTSPCYSVFLSLLLRYRPAYLEKVSLEAMPKPNLDYSDKNVQIRSA